jgi:uncharacterized membrane protein
MGNLDPLRHYKHNLHGTFGSDRFGVAAERFARFFGTPKFIIGQTIIVICWIVINGFIIARVLSGHAFDPYPFILLNLLFSTQAAYAAPLILLAQTRQADRDKASEEASAQHRQEESNRQVTLLNENTDITRKVHNLAGQLHEMSERQIRALGGLDHINAELNVLRQAIAPGVPNPEEGIDGGPCSDPGVDSVADSGECPPVTVNLSGVHGHDQPADAAGDPPAAGS